MGAGASQGVQPVDEQYGHNELFQSTRSLRTFTRNSAKSVRNPPDTRSVMLRTEKTKKEIQKREERELNEQNGFTPFTPRGTIGYGSNTQVSSQPGKKAKKAASTSGKKTAGGGGVSFKSKNVYISDDEGDWDSGEEDDGLTGKEKIESYLRKSRVPETKVRSLAIKISEQARRELEGQLQHLQVDTKQMRNTLITTLQKPLDLMLYGKVNKTVIKKTESSLEDLVQKVSDTVELLETDMAICFDAVQRHVSAKTSNKSVPLLVRDSVCALETDYDILFEKYHELRKEKEDALEEQTKTQHKTQALEETSLMVEKEFKKVADQNREMNDYINELKIHRRQLKNHNQQLDEDNARLKKQVSWYQESNAIVHKDIMKYKEVNTQLQVQVTDQAKEIRRLKDPDKDMIHKIQRLETELTEAKTANRRLELEKGNVKTQLTKLQAHYDSLQRERGSLVKQKQKLQKENEKVKTTNKKLKLSS